MTHEYDDCLKCEEHKAWEERMKILDRVPGLIGWMNVAKGAIAVIIVILPMLYSSQVSDRGETHQRLKEHEVMIAHKQDRVNDQVSAIRGDTEAIRTSVAVLVKSNEIKAQEVERAIEELKRMRR
jgi:hypothetical protein